ncbi:MAG TPA: hypothetical protein VFK59_10255 [Actinomycetota bacterium]|jgi:hypothetical protein|nr:hypothetical protein [Actinomycetota bacterium]
MTLAGILAHGLGGRVDLPVPRWMFVFGAGTALVVSFVALAALWREPRFEGRAERRGRPSAIQRVLTNRALEWTIRLLSLGFFVVVTIASFLPLAPTETIGPVVVFIWFWVGLAFAQAFLGNWWATLSPFDTLGRLLGFDESERGPTRPYPKAWGMWPAAMLLFGFVWLELADPFADRPGTLGYAIVGYTLITLGGMAIYGRRAWVEHGEAFAVYLGLFARMSLLTRDRDGLVVPRPPLGGLATLRPRPGLLALILVALGSTTFDGFSRSSWWDDWTGTLTGVPETLAETAGLLGTILLVAGLYAIAMLVAGWITGEGWHVPAVRFAHSLVPIAFAYVVAHYFSFLLIEGQIGIARLSDPFDRGWNLFGTADRLVDLTLLSATTIWYVQVVAIVAGHIGGVILAHDRAIAVYPPGVALRTQYALLGVMIVFTATGLLILSG